MINRKVKVFLYKLKKEGRVMQDFNVTFRYAIQRECTLEWRVKRDCIDYNNLVFILKGKALYKIDGNEQVLSENQVLLIPAGSLRKPNGLRRNL